MTNPEMPKGERSEEEIKRDFEEAQNLLSEAANDLVGEMGYEGTWAHAEAKSQYEYWTERFEELAKELKAAGEKLKEKREEK